MKLLPLLFAAIASVASVHAALTVIDYDTVQPFAEPKPVTAEEKAAVKYKPQLEFVDGCRPYPAVDANGTVSSGFLQPYLRDRDCIMPAMGSQVYSRADWYDDKWAIMYAWYLPRNRDKPHGWVWAIVWIDDPALETSTVLGVSMPAIIGFRKRSPPKGKYLDGSSVKLELYLDRWVAAGSMLTYTEDEGEQQDLIQWDQLTDAARDSLNIFDFSETLCPLSDEMFAKTLKKASPF